MRHEDKRTSPRVPLRWLRRLVGGLGAQPAGGGLGPNALGSMPSPAMLSGHQDYLMAPVEPQLPTLELTAVTVVDYLDDACQGCPNQSADNCVKRCAYFLGEVGRIPEGPPIEWVPPTATVSRSAPALLPSLPGPEAASGFVLWLRQNKRCGQFTNVQLRHAYLMQCTENKRRPTAENVMREALKQMQGVTRESVRDEKQRDRRARVAIWTIEQKPSVSAPETVPETLTDRIPTLQPKLRRVA